MASMQFPSNPTLGQLHTPGPGKPTYACRVVNPPDGNVWEKVGMGYSYSPVAFTATPGQTTFAVNYQVGAVQVYVEGGRLAEDEFTATNGTSIVMPEFNGGERVIVLPSSIISTLDSLKKSLNGSDIPSPPDFRTALGLPALPVTQKLSANGQFLVFDLEPDTLYRGAAKFRAVADDTFIAQVAPAAGAWNTTTAYTYQQISASGATAAALAGGFAGIPIASADASANWGGLVEFLFFSGNAAESAHITFIAGTLDATGNAKIYFADSIQNAMGAVAQVRFGMTIGANLAAGSRAHLQKLI